MPPIASTTASSIAPTVATSTELAALSTEAAGFDRLPFRVAKPAEKPASKSPRLDLFALTRALVFTKGLLPPIQKRAGGAAVDAGSRACR